MTAESKRGIKAVNMAWAGWWTFKAACFANWKALLHPHRWHNFTWARYFNQATSELFFLGITLVWLAFAMAMNRNRTWGWWGSFVFATLSLFVALYIALMMLTFVHSDGWRGRDFAYVVPAALVLGALLRGRDDYLRGKVGIKS